MIICPQGAQFYVQKFQEHGPIYKTHLLGSPTVRVSGASLLRPLISCEPHGLVMKIPTSARSIMGDSSILTTSGDNHARMKRKLLEAFTPTRSASTSRVSRHILHYQFCQCRKLMKVAQFLGA